MSDLRPTTVTFEDPVLQAAWLAHQEWLRLEMDSLREKIASDDERRRPAKADR